MPPVVSQGTPKVFRYEIVYHDKTVCPGLVGQSHPIFKKKSYAFLDMDVCIRSDVCNE